MSQWRIAHLGLVPMPRSVDELVRWLLVSGTRRRHRHLVEIPAEGAGIPVVGGVDLGSGVAPDIEGLGIGTLPPKPTKKK
jgi:hypothetical protein